mmetsp:Transcript_6079/g.23637  ORF Transcript_6079/g.23637 Transcript_6079/m.23637 type:complete len:220 (+) Transcript_6079:4267-4926(+)
MVSASVAPLGRELMSPAARVFTSSMVTKRANFPAFTSTVPGSESCCTANRVPPPPKMMPVFIISSPICRRSADITPRLRFSPLRAKTPWYRISSPRSSLILTLYWKMGGLETERWSMFTWTSKGRDASAVLSKSLGRVGFTSIGFTSIGASGSGGATGWRFVTSTMGSKVSPSGAEAAARSAVSAVRGGMDPSPGPACAVSLAAPATAAAGATSVEGWS